ncbi:MAG: hypothetical protein LBG91_00025 [Treponema sp.]|jgi:hypothetical protein|nr:hypothetical protein [Treponema sp.]
MVFTMTVAGCVDGSTGGTGDGGSPTVTFSGGDPTGTWFRIRITSDGKDIPFSPAEVKFNNGNYEDSLDGVFFSRGTYTTIGNEITLIPTHRYAFLPGKGYGWYSRDELSEDYLKLMIIPPRGYYSVSGNTLVIGYDTGNGKYFYTYSRK